MNYEYEFPIGNEPAVIVDAGANIGLATVYFKWRYPKAKIIALEPDRSNFDMLVMNSRELSDIVPLQMALWRSNGHLELVSAGVDKWGISVREGEAQNANVQATTASDLMDKFAPDGVDLFKMDIEGAEVEVFKSNVQWLARVGVLIVELHEHLQPGCTRLFNEAISTIRHKTFQSGENSIVQNLDRL